MGAMPSADPRSGLDPALAGRLKRNEAGLVAVVTQDATSGEVLMQAWMNDEALAATLATRRATYWSRSRDELWVKGLTSGHTQVVREVRLDCDGDTVLLKVDQTGVACHTGDRTCFDSDLLLADPSPATHVHHLSDQQAMERP
ncbi:Phosphoribosyl-AMP cyclohydrolase [Aestuariimicrobium sp. T2.26MG-19.2B]|uniref:phosphoribosyl-AMP cyclohydrolase n=2 Tax=Aestuariimicrobium sp. T2.26MG-19.2B TaxID=3040679 RepID=UPI0024778ACB|nr:phosphoribosyl-AMP cyclohydrolase [Aestuariimicrobium sp. T2.26MG-19.2B]CAI9410220.1 Phosphoribosyl-AMP cyclohydrolase [Aestuariimicrobium sp. T2.26MG-19.2B]